MYQRIRSHLTYANVMVTILAFIVLGDMGYAATGGNFIPDGVLDRAAEPARTRHIGDAAISVPVVRHSDPVSNRA